jgi:hypothetical protein
MTGALLTFALLSGAAGALSDGPVLAQDRRGDLRLALDLTLNTALSPPRSEGEGLGEGPGEGRGEGDAAARTRRIQRWERALEWSTAGALVVTSTLGTMAAINQPTAFGHGRCQTGSPVLGTYGCDRGLSTLHGSSGVLSATLYTASGVLALAIPGPASKVSGRARPWHRALGYVHLGGIVLQPILGLVSAFPQVIGMSTSAPDDRFPRNTRTIHVGLGYVTTAAYLAALALER